MVLAAKYILTVPFQGDVVVKPIRPEGKRWELVQSFSYIGARETFTIPAGFRTDFASVPRVFVWLLPRYGRWTEAAILHDYLWELSRQNKFRKSDADGIFNRAMRELGVPYLRRWIIWAAVRWASGPRELIAPGPGQVLKVVLISVPTVVFLAVPVLAVFAALVVFALAEWVAYLPLRLLHRDKTKTVNRPGLDELVRT